MATKLNLEDYDAKIVTSVHIDSYKFDRMVEKAYGGKCEFIAIQETNDNSQYEFDVSRPEEFQNTKYVRYKMKTIRSGEYPDYSAKRIFQCLVEDGYIPPAIYTVKVSW